MSDKRNWPLYAVALAIGIIGAVAFARAYIGYRSGFLTQDEAMYFYSVLLSRDAHTFVPDYSERVGFQLILLVYSLALGIGDIFSYLLLGPALTALFSAGTIITIHKITKLMNVSQGIRVLTVLSVPLFYVFSLISGFMISESPALFFTMLGIYVFLRGQQKNNWMIEVGSIAFFLVAWSARETFVLYALAPIGALTYVVWKKSRAVAVGIVAASMLALLQVALPKLSGSPALRSQTLENMLFSYQFAVKYGWSPILFGCFLLGAIWLLFTLKDAGNATQTVFLVLVAILSQLTLLVEYFFEGGIGSAYYSGLIRFSYAGLPGAFVCIPQAGKALDFLSAKLDCWNFDFKIRKRRSVAAKWSFHLPRKVSLTTCLAAILTLSLAWNLIQAPTLLSFSQTALQDVTVFQVETFQTTAISTVSTGSNAQITITTTIATTGRVNPLSPTARFASTYKSQPMRLYEVVSKIYQQQPNAKVLVIACCLWVHTLRARVFLHEFSNLNVILPPLNRSTFSHYLDSYDYVFLYGEYFASSSNYTMRYAPTYYMDLLSNRTSSKVFVEWQWAEGYLYILPVHHGQTPTIETTTTPSDDSAEAHHAYMKLTRPQWSGMTSNNG